MIIKWDAPSAWLSTIMSLWGIATTGQGKIVLLKDLFICLQSTYESSNEWWSANPGYS